MTSVYKLIGKDEPDYSTLIVYPGEVTIGETINIENQLGETHSYLVLDINEGDPKELTVSKVSHYE